MGENCLICNCTVKAVKPHRPPGPAVSKKGKIKLPEVGLSNPQSITLCKALNIPTVDFRKYILKSPICKECCKRIQNMVHIITALESLQDTVRQFRSEICHLLQESLEATVARETDPVSDGSDGDGNSKLGGGDDDGAEEKHPVLVLVGGEREREREEPRRDQSNANGQNEFRKKILDILQRRFIRATRKEKKPVNKEVPISPAPSIPTSSPSKKIKLEPGSEDNDTKRLVVSLERLDLSKYSNLKYPTIPKSPDTPMTPIITKVRSMRKSVNFFEPIAASTSANDDDDENWQPPSSPIGDADDGDTFSVGDFKEEADANFVIMPDEDSRRSKGWSEDEGNRSGAETSAYYDSSDPEDDDDLAPAKPKKHYKSKKKVIGEYYCQHCERNFKDEFILDIHIKRRHEGIKLPFKCTEEGCTKAFRQKFVWAHHINEHKTGLKSGNKYKCETCGKSFTTSNSMNRHASSHTGKWKFPCTLCTKGFHRPSELATHLKRHEDPKHNCNFCDEKFETKHEVIHHMVDVHPDQDFKDKKMCDHCGKAFSGSDALRCHKLQIHHVGEFKHKCDICGKGYAKLSWMTRHRLSHGTERTFACKECPETFRFSASLRVHRMKHEGRYPHSCEFCDRKFILRQALHQHLATHTTDKPFICEYCGKTFANKFYLALHIRRTHWEKIGLEERPKYLVHKSKPSLGSKKSTEAKSIKNKRKKKKLSESSEDTEPEMVLGLNLEASDNSDAGELDEKDMEEVTQILVVEQIDKADETQKIEEIETQRLETDPFIDCVVTQADN